MRIAGATIPDDKRVVIALTYIFGIGPSRSRALLGKTKIDENMRIKDLKQDEISVLQKKIGEYTVEGELRREISSNIKRLRDIKAYRGMRHARRLPVRGQRTKTNSRTIRGNVRITMGSGRRKLEKT